MLGSISTLIASLLKIGAVVLVLNEVRGIVLALPVLWGMYEAGGTLMAIWLGFSSLAGIALSVAVPAYAASKLKKTPDARLTTGIDPRLRPSRPCFARLPPCGGHPSRHLHQSKVAPHCGGQHNGGDRGIRTLATSL